MERRERSVLFSLFCFSPIPLTPHFLPEFHLVAGGEELFQEDGLLASPKGSRSPDPPDFSASRLDLRDDASSSSASTPEATPVEYTSRVSSAVPIARRSSHGNLSARGRDPHTIFNAFPSTPSSNLDLSLAGPSSMPSMSPLQQPAFRPDTMQMYQGSGLFTLPSSSRSHFSEGADSFPAPIPTSEVVALNLWAEGMIPFVVDIERLSAAMATNSPSLTRQSGLTSVLLRIKISISSIEDIQSSPNLHGFQAAISLSERWTTEAKCITKVFTGPNLTSQDINYLEGMSTSPIHMGGPNSPSRRVTCTLPDSPLTRCKWLEYSTFSVLF